MRRNGLIRPSLRDSTACDSQSIIKLAFYDLRLLRHLLQYLRLSRQKGTHSMQYKRMIFRATLTPILAVLNSYPVLCMDKIW